MDLGGLARGARQKGVHLLGTGDATHPEWLACIRRQLKPTGDGVYECGGVHFLVTGEVSASWQAEGKGRRVHLLLLLPSIAAAHRASRCLSRMGAVQSEGRPALRAAAVDVVDAVWAAAPGAVVIPAHVWTPWYSVFGARSGFDSLDACFGPYADRIRAIETGLSSDPSMCRRVSMLDSLTLVSFSDAHSPDRLGREATILALEEISFPAVASALTGSGGCAGTIELFPQEGKYYQDGHRACGISVTPGEARRLRGRCPACGRALTPGVLHRVEELADRALSRYVPPHDHVIPLDEIVGHLLRRGPRTQTVAAAVEELVRRYGSQLAVLVERPVEDLRDANPLGLADAIAAVRAGHVTVTAGYDGVYGTAQPNV
jgi:uncharacterized protein (TIGR00375 family)